MYKRVLASHNTWKTGEMCSFQVIELRMAAILFSSFKECFTKAFYKKEKQIMPFYV
jgi:hypothetical protein